MDTGNLSTVMTINLDDFDVRIYICNFKMPKKQLERSNFIFYVVLSDILYLLSCSFGAFECSH